MYNYKITVFTPAYNRGELLKRLYQSLKRQSVTDFEWLIIDDGSTDDTADICASFEENEHDFPIRYHHVQNGGKTRAVNRGLDLAEGELFFIVDSDDYLTDNALERILYWANTLSDEEKNTFCGVSGDKIFENGESVGTTLRGEFFDCTSLQRDKLGVNGDKAEAFFTDIFKKYKFPEFEGEKFITESLVYFRMAKDGYKIRFFNEGIYVCEYREDGLTKNALALHTKNPMGSMLTAKERLCYDEIGRKLKIATIYYCYNGVKKAGIEPREIKNNLGISSFTLYTALIIGHLHEIKKNMKRETPTHTGLKGYYICTQEEGYFDNPHGVAKKILTQIQCFRNAGLNVTLYPFSFLPNTRLRKVLRRIPFFSVACDFKYQREFDGSDFFYIRAPRGEYSFVKLLKKLRKHSPNAKILLEIATYPYDSENASRLVDKPMVMKDRVNRKKYVNYADKAVIFCQYDNVFGLPTIATVNGVNVADIKPVSPASEDNDTINVIAVAMLANWHGYDRFIRGLGEYYRNGGTEKIHFHLVGTSGDNTHSDLITLAKKECVYDKVTFYGAKSGKELDDIYANCSVGIECLSLFKQGPSKLSSSLKSREYWSKGLPFITSCEFTQDTSSIAKYIHDVPFDDTPIDINAFLEFYNSVYADDKTHEKTISTLRQYAFDTCDMSVTMKPVIDFIKEENN